MRYAGFDLVRLEAAPMRTSAECAAMALDLDGRAMECPVGPLRDGFSRMAADWRRLCNLAKAHEKLKAG